MKRIFAFVLCAAMVLSLAVCAAAEEDNFLYDSSVVEGDSLLCFGAPLPEGGKVIVTAGGSNVDFAMTTPAQSNLAITYFCMVDQSGALSNVQRDHQKEALLLISENMRANDKMVLVLMHETLTFSEPMMDREERYQAIQDACNYTSRYTTLFSNVSDVLEQMADSQRYSGLRCVVLFSDGINDRNNGVTEDNAREAIRHYQFPFNTISITNTFPDGYALKNVARMDSFSEEYPGGIHTAPVRDKIEVADAVKQVMDGMLATTAIRLDAASLDRSRDQLDIQVSWQSGEESRTGTVTVNVDTLPEIIVETEPETTVPETTVPETTEPETTEAATEPETTAPETTETEAPETEETTTQAAPTETTLDEEAARYQKESKRSRDTLIVGAVVLLIILAIVLLILRRKHDDPEDPQDGPAPEDNSTPESVSVPEAEEEKPLDIPLVFAQETQPEATQEPLVIPEAPEEKAEEKPETPVILPPVPEEKEPAAEPEIKEEPALPADIPPAMLEGTQVLPKPPVTPQQAEKPADLGLGSFFEGLNLEAGPGADVRLEPVGGEDETVEFFVPINTALSLGRTAKADVVLNKDDRALSGIHFELQWDGRALFLRDAKSTNGTGVNGVPMRAGNWVRVNNGAIIRAGAHKYKVYAFKSK